ncbi:MAG: ATP synthase F1 subunit delta [Bdellovibrionaceae bacterium]|nr:ATP synthase F1 subunit delta [Pseudobdellovibrionaceae bacterium]
MKSNVVTAKYAKALFDVTYANGKSGEVATQLLELAKAFNNTSTVTFFDNPFNAHADKLAVLNNTLENKAYPEVINFMMLLVDKNRMGLIAEMAKEYSTLVQSAAGITKGKIFSATLLNEAFVSQVEATVSKTLNRKIELAFEKDETLIAEYKVQVGGWTLDDSVKTHLKTLKEELMKRGL